MHGLQARKQQTGRFRPTGAVISLGCDCPAWDSCYAGDKGRFVRNGGADDGGVCQHR